MTRVDLRRLKDGEFVFHFGGRPNEVNVNTFANSILALSEAIQEINRQVNPDFSLEIVIDAVGTGSFRARLKSSGKKLTSLFKESMHHILIGVLAALLYDRLFAANMQIIVQDDSYIVQHGDDRVVLPRAVYEAKERIRNRGDIDRHIARAFETLDDDPSITEFGITPNLGDRTPLAVISREEFALLSTPELTWRTEEDPNHRVVNQAADLIVVRAVLERGNRKWQFVWNGIRISAPITDETFFDRLAMREFEFGQGDTLHVVLAIYQVRDEMSGAYLNEKYEVIEVKGRTKGPQQQTLIPK